MEETFEKIDETRFKKISTKIEENIYDYNFLLQQKKELEKSLLEVNELLKKANEIGIIELVIKEERI